MDPVSAALFLVQGQNQVDSCHLNASLLRKEHAVQNELVSMLAEQTPVDPGDGTGQYLNIIA
jgi:hypothetical protein